MAESGIRRRQPRTPEMGCRLPGVGSQSPEPGSQFPKNKMEIPDSGGQMQVPGAQHETMLGEVENPTIGPNDQKKFGSPNDAPSPQKTFDFESFYLPPGADISKYRRFLEHVGGRRRKRSHGQQHKPCEPCARFPDYGRGQALTPSNQYHVVPAAPFGMGSSTHELEEDESRRPQSTLHAIFYFQDSHKSRES